MKLSRVAYIGFGSNVGKRRENCQRALEQLDSSSKTKVLRVSSFYLTEPVGMKDQDWFINGAAKVATELTPGRLLAQLLKIEELMGRQRLIHWGPRIIDLDIIFFGDLIVEEENLTIPHRHLQDRRFVLEPLAEIAPDKVHPVLGKTIIELLQNLPVNGERVERLITL